MKKNNPINDLLKEYVDSVAEYITTLEEATEFLEGLEESDKKNNYVDDLRLM